MKALNLLQKLIVLSIIRVGWTIKPGSVTPLFAWFLRSKGAQVEGRPNYLSAKIWFDGTDYRLITLGDGCTISSNVRILTHDAALHTVGKEFGQPSGLPYIRKRAVVIGKNSFIGTGSIIMPGADIGAGCIVAAGSVVRGKIPRGSIVMGSPAAIVGKVEEYIKRIERDNAQTNSRL